VLELFKTPFSVDSNEMFVGVSIGVALAPADGEDQERLMKNADIALYRAKQAGRGTFRMFEPQMDAELQERKTLEQALRQALAKGQFELHYQPLITVEGEELAGVEALLRWRHPERGIVSPDEFIPVAEETGLIVPIGEWVLRTACEQIKAWPGMYVAVNLSPVQFKHQDLLDTVKHILDVTELDAHRLELEITEGVLLYDTRGALEILSALKAIGVKVAMDDFGTGYSSLGYLNCFPFDKIEIDRSFVSSLGQTEKSDAIVRSVISLGGSLRMVTIAEGVETLEQLNFLEGEGCQQIQGFYYGRPMPAEDLTKLRSEWKRRKSAA
jgi:predicted signal transduction protein with EAL and GGDEF domain